MNKEKIMENEVKNQRMVEVMAKIIEVSKITGVQIENIAFDILPYSYISGVCYIKGQEAELPKILPNDNIRKVLLKWAINFMPDKIIPEDVIA